MTDALVGYATADGVATIAFDRPDALNALTPEMLVRLGDLLEQATADDDAGVVVLTGVGRAFSAGVDLKALAGREIVDGAVGAARARELSYTARTFTGADAAAWGLAAQAVPLEQLDAAVTDLCATLLANSPGSLAAYKDLYGVALDEGLAAGLAYEEGTRYPIPDTAERVADFR